MNNNRIENSMKQLIQNHIEKSIATKTRLLENSSLESIENAGEIITDALAAQGKLLLAGNGGSAADAQHIAAELIIRYRSEPVRRSLGAISLVSDSSILSAGANDLGYDDVFSRQVEGLGKAGDVFLGITTSGNSPNILNAFMQAKQMGLKNILLTGRTGGKILSEHGALVDCAITVPEDTTAHIQEAHITIGHILCEHIEFRLFGME